MKVEIVFVLLAGMSVCGAQSKTGARAAPKRPQRSFAGETPATIAGSVGETLKFAEDNFLGVAEPMPEDKYSYIPTIGKFDGVRSFGEQVKHVACAQVAFFNEFEGKKPPDDCERDGHDPAKTKAELIEYLKASFNYANRVIATLTAENALDRIEGRYAGPNTKLASRSFQFGT
jgi:hypothetical protein